MQRAPLGVDDFARLRNHADPEADSLVDALVAELKFIPEAPDFQVLDGDVLGRLLQAVIRWEPGAGESGELDPKVLEFLRKRDLPAWFDAQRVRNAQLVFQERRDKALLVLGCASLPECYAQPEIASTLIVSGRLADQVRRRLVETVEFLLAVMEPGALDPQGTGHGWAWIRKVRLIHAVMRKLTLLNSRDYQRSSGNPLVDFLLAREWRRLDSTPIDQLELSFVLLTFSWVVVHGWSRLGVSVNASQRADYMFAWTVIGRVLGIADDRLLPPTEAEGRALFAQLKGEFKRRESELGAAAQRASSLDPDEPGRLLCVALGVILVAMIRVSMRKRLRARLRLMRLRSLEPWLDRQFERPWVVGFFLSLPRTLMYELLGAATAQRLWIVRIPYLHSLLGNMILRRIARIEPSTVRAAKKYRMQPAGPQ